MSKTAYYHLKAIKQLKKDPVFLQFGPQKTILPSDLRYARPYLNAIESLVDSTECHVLDAVTQLNPEDALFKEFGFDRGIQINLYNHLKSVVFDSDLAANPTSDLLKNYVKSALPSELLEFQGQNVDAVIHMLDAYAQQLLEASEDWDMVMYGGEGALELLEGLKLKGNTIKQSLAVLEPYHKAIKAANSHTDMSIALEDDGGQGQFSP